MKVQILGSNSGGLFVKRYFSAQLLRSDGKVYLIDCGEGTQMQIARYGAKIERLDQIFISHLHGDHVLGLVGLISSFSMHQRTRPLHVYGPDGLKKFLEVQFDICSIHLSFPVEVHLLSCNKSMEIFEDESVTVQTIPLKHRVPAIGYLFRTKPSKFLNIRTEAIQKFGLSVEQIKAAKLSKKVYDSDDLLIPSEQLVLPPKPTLSYAYCSDTGYSETVVKLVQGIDVLYHEATFLDKQRLRALETGHSTAHDAALVAQKAGVGKLMLGHLSGRYDNWEMHLDEACAIFRNTIGAEEGKTYQISSGDCSAT